MEYSEIVTLTKNGILIPEKLLHPVGIYDGSRCWGTPISNVGFKLNYRKEERPDNHILLSPIPFNSWACTLRIQIRIKDDPGKLQEFLEILSQPSLCTNIISVSGNTAGYYNGRIIILVELHNLRKEAERIKKIKLNEVKLREITQFSVNIFERIVNIKNEIKKANRNKNNTSESAFLYETHVATGGNYLWLTDEKDKIVKKKEKELRSEIEREFEDCEVHNLSCRWLRTQAMAYLYSEYEQPLRFDYSLNEKMLKPSLKDEDSTTSIANSLGIKRPAMFFATFHPTSKYVRLVSLQESSKEMNHKKKLIKINYQYSCSTRAEGKDISCNGSNGLLHHVTQKLSSQISLNQEHDDSSTYPDAIEFSIKNIISYSRRDNRRSERGEIEILGCCDGVSQPPLDVISTAISTQIGGFSNATNNTDNTPSQQAHFESNTKINFVTPYHIFLSCREEIKKDSTFSRTLEELEKYYGIKIEKSNESAETVTSDVLNTLSQVDALLIIFSITQQEWREYMQVPDKNNYRPNLGWLLFELGIGMTKKMPIVQFRDTTNVLPEHWSQWVNVGKDTSLFYIDRSKKDDMKKKLEYAVQEIIKKLSSRKG